MVNKNKPLWQHPDETEEEFLERIRIFFSLETNNSGTEKPQQQKDREKQ